MGDALTTVDDGLWRGINPDPTWDDGTQYPEATDTAVVDHGVLIEDADAVAGILFGPTSGDLEIDVGSSLSIGSSGLEFLSAENSVFGNGNVTCAGPFTLFTGSEFSPNQVTFDAASGSHNVTMAGVTLECDVTINCAGATLNLQDAWDINGAVTITDGTVVLGDDWTVAGDLTGTAGTVTWGTYTCTHSGTHNVSWAMAAGIGNYILASGADITRTGTVYVCKLTIPADATLEGASSLSAMVSANDALSVAKGATVTGGDVLIRCMGANRTNTADLDFDGVTVKVVQNDVIDLTFTQNGDLIAAALSIHSGMTTKYSKLVSGGDVTIAGAVTLGHATTDDKHGEWDMGSGVVRVGGNIGMAKATDTVAGVLNFNAAKLRYTGGTFSGNNQGTKAMIVDNTSGRVLRCGGSKPTIEDVTMNSGVLRAYGVTDGGNNTGIRFRARRSSGATSRTSTAA